MLQRTIMIMIFTASCFVVQASDKKQIKNFIECVGQLQHIANMRLYAITQEEKKVLGEILNNTMDRCIQLNPVQQFAAPKVSVAITIPKSSYGISDPASPNGYDC